MTRDTDRDWEVIAEHNPFFGVLSNEQFLGRSLPDHVLDEFYATGEADVAHVAAMVERATGGPPPTGVVLDFGCGVGRLSLALARRADRVIAVDVAEAMLAVGREQAARQGVRNVEFTATLPQVEVDWVNSLIVFQHIPPARGYALLGELLGRVRPGGVVSLQVTFFHDPRHRGEILRDERDYAFDGDGVRFLSDEPVAEPGAMTMFDYDLNRVLRLLFLGGFDVVTAQHTDHGGCHGAWLFAARAIT
jgi:SAM-dependent methyltransferase